MDKKIFSQKKFLLLAHYATFAYQDMLFEYLTNKNKAELVTKFNLPLPELPLLHQIEITKSKNGKVGKTRKIKSFVNPPLAAYFLQSFQIFFYTLGSKTTYDYIISQDSLLAFLSIFLKKMGKTKKIIFYSHGIDRLRFQKSFFNTLYSSLDKISATNSDFCWFLSRGMIPIRKAQGISDSKLFWIPSSIPISSIKRNKNEKNHKLVFLGTVNKKNGAHLLLNILKAVQIKIPDATLDIMGDGDLKKTLEKEVKVQNLQKSVKFFGSLTFQQFSPLLTNYSIGLAPYEYSTDNLTPLSDSLKMRVYLAAGLPVIITSGFHFSDEIKEHSLGFAVKDNVKDFSKSILKLLENKEYYKKIRQNALSYSRTYDLTKIYDRVFKQILK